MFQRTSILKYRQDTLVHLTKRLALLVLCCCVVGGSLRAQRRAALEQQRKQLLQEINQTNALLEKTKQDKAAALDRYFALQNQIQKRQQLVKTLQSEISSADAGIE